MIFWFRFGRSIYRMLLFFFVFRIKVGFLVWMMGLGIVVFLDSLRSLGILILSFWSLGFVKG